MAVIIDNIESQTIQLSTVTMTSYVTEDPPLTVTDLLRRVGHDTLQTNRYDAIADVINMTSLLDSGNSSYAENKTQGEGVSEDSRTLPEKAGIACVLGMVILLTVGGNILVCVTIYTNRKLKTCTNYFILSLAITDLLLGCLVLPFSALMTLDLHWPLGAAFCNVYTACDVMLCTVSILTLFAISLDRYFAVTIPLRYTQRMNGKIVFGVCSGIWIFSFLMAFVPIHLGWNTATGAVMNWAAPDQCVFELNKAYVLLVSLGTYFAPLLIMCAVYLKVLQITRTQVKEINKLTKAGSGLHTAMLEPPPPPPLPPLAPSGGGGGGSRNGTRASGRNGSRGQNGRQQSIGSLKNGVAGQRSSVKTGGINWHSPRFSGQHTVRSKHREHKLLSDTKATVTLASVILAFAICWVPYFVLFTAKPFLSGDVNAHVDLLALWLGYVNSSINPFLYAFYNSSFREGFRKVLCRHRLRRMWFDMQDVPLRSPNSETNQGHLSFSESEMNALR